MLKVLLVSYSNNNNNNDNELVYTFSSNMKNTCIASVVSTSKIFLNDVQISENEFARQNLFGLPAEILLNKKILEEVRIYKD